MTATGVRAPRLVLWGFAATAVALVHNRLWATPNLAYFSSIAEHLGSRPFGADPGPDYLLTNLGLPALARLLSQTEPHEYARLHLVVLLLGLLGCVVLAARRHGHDAARSLTVLVAAAPGVTVAMQWLGQPDALTFPLGIALALLRTRWALVLVAVALGLTHPEQGAFVALSAAAARFALNTALDLNTAVGSSPARRGRLIAVAWDLAAMAGGVLAGRAVTELYLRVNDIEILRPRTSLLGLGLRDFVEHHSTEPVATLYLLWGPLWLVIGAVTVARLATRTARGSGGPGRAWVVLAATALVMLAPVAITLDQTRVYAVLTAPLLGAVAVLVGVDPATRVLASAPAAAALLAITIVVPGGFTAGTSTWSHELPPGEATRFLRDGTHPGDVGPAGLEAWLMTPFDFVIPAAVQN